MISQFTYVLNTNLRDALRIQSTHLGQRKLKAFSSAGQHCVCVLTAGTAPVEPLSGSVSGEKCTKGTQGTQQVAQTLGTALSMIYQPFLFQLWWGLMS